MKFINKILNWFNKKPNKETINQKIIEDDFFDIWDSIINSNTKWICSMCESFDVTKCNRCDNYNSFIFKHSPTTGEALNYLENLKRYHEDRKEGLYSLDDYEKE